ncbi:MAG: hypothetical protein AB1351_06105 [Thermoproteota archaeon]
MKKTAKGGQDVNIEDYPALTRGDIEVTGDAAKHWQHLAKLEKEYDEERQRFGKTRIDK